MEPTVKMESTVRKVQPAWMVLMVRTALTVLTVLTVGLLTECIVGDGSISNNYVIEYCGDYVSISNHDIEETCRWFPVLASGLRHG